MRMQVKLEIGHKAACRLEPTPEGYTHDWTIFVRGSEGKDISHFVEKVIFHLHESFPKPKRVIKEPPYKLDESGYGGFELQVEVCFKTKDEPRRVHFTYDLFLPLNGLPPVTSVRTEALTFTHPTEDFMKKLVKGGGIPISAVNGVSNGISNGHPLMREETKEPVQKIASNVSENEKTKKTKIPKSSSKPSSAGAGIKRSPPVHEQTDAVPRKKKKSIDGSSSSKTKHSQGESIVTPLSQPLTTEVKDLKVKFKPIPPKETVEKERKKDVDKSKTSHSTKSKESKSQKSEHESKKLEKNEHKVKVKKKGEKSEKKRSSEKKEKSKSKKDKIEKVTIRRSSGDSWASAGGSGLMSNVVAKNRALGKLLSEMSSDEDDEDLPTPFKREPSPVLTKISLKEKSETLFKPEPVTTHASHKEKDDLPLPFIQESSQALPKNTQSGHKEQTVYKEQTIHKEQNNHKDQTSKKEEKTNKNGLKKNSSHVDSKNTNHVENNIEEQLSHPSESSELMDTSSTIENGVSKGEKLRDPELSKKELFDLYEQITNCEDTQFLQKVVDVIETTGLFTVAEKTFEFDLCSLENSTLQQLKKCLGNR